MSQVLPTATARRSWRELGRLALGHRRLAVGAVIMTVLASTCSVIVPILLGRVVDLVVDGGTMTGLAILVGQVVVAALAAGVLTGWASRFCDQLGVTMAAQLREQVIERSLTLDPTLLERAGTGDVTSRVTGDVQVINDSVRLAAGVFMSLVTVILTAVGFASLDWRLACAFLAVFPVYFFSLRWYLPTSAPQFAGQLQANAVRTRTVLSSLHGTSTVHAYGMEGRHTTMIDGASRKAIDATLRVIRTFLKFSITMNGAEAVGLGALLGTGFLLVRADLVTVGAVTAAALMFHRLFGPLGMLLMSFNDVQLAGAALARLVGIVDLPEPPQRPQRPMPDRAAIEGKAVVHAYIPGVPVLDGVDVRVPAGQSLAVVGESGAGKTTLAAILGGVFPTTSGRVMIGDDELDDLDPPQLRRRVGVVTQEVHTFVGELREDLRLADPEADDERLMAAVREVGAEGWVRALPDGLSTRVGEGEHQLGAAQAQQIALARVVLADPPIVILDEATAEAGSAGARELEASARAVIAGRTAIVVAHRLTQARECDQIAVMADGQIIEYGSHDTLVSAGGTYAELWAAWDR